MKKRLLNAVIVLVAFVIVLLAAIEAVGAALPDHGSAIWLWEMPRVSGRPDTSDNEPDVGLLTFTSPVAIREAVFISVLPTPPAQ